MNYEIIKKDLTTLCKRDLESYVYFRYSGNGMKKFRQGFVEYLTGEKRPVTKCGVVEIVRLILEKGGAK